MDGECSSSAVASSFVGMVAGSKYRNSSINCDCEVCATDAKYCATSIPRLGFMNEDGIGNTEHVRQTRKNVAPRCDRERLQYTKYLVRPTSLILSGH